jgi:hypothetical protein
MVIVPAGIAFIPAGMVVVPVGMASVPAGMALILVGMAFISAGRVVVPAGIGHFPLDPPTSPVYTTAQKHKFTTEQGVIAGKEREGKRR